MLEDSVKKRFIFKFVISIFSSALNFGLLLFFPKFLGPAKYGQYEFAVNNFTVLIGALTFSIPDAYFNWISRKAKKLKIGEVTAVTFAFLLLISLGVLLFIFVVNLLGVFNSIWPGITVMAACLGLLIAFGTQFFNICSILADGLGLTATFEFFRLAQNIMKVLFTGILCYLGIISLHGALLAFFLAIVFSCIVALTWFNKKEILRGDDFKAHRWEREHLKVYSLFTLDYVKPLVMYSGLSFAFSFFDIWFLQYAGDSAQQGYLGISTRLAGLAGLITLAIQPILVREFAVAFEHQNHDRMKVLFDRIRFFYFISFFVGIILFFNAELILGFVGGKEFESAVVVFKALAFYPTLQTLGRLHGAIYYSTARTKIYSTVGIIVMPLGILLSYYLLGHTNSLIPGLDLGAKGVAYKMIIIDTLSILLLLFYNAVFVKTSFSRQVMALVIASVVQIGLYFLIEQAYQFAQFDLSHMNYFAHFQELLSAAIKIGCFVIGLIMIILTCPALIGFSRNDLTSHLKIRRS